MLEFVITLSFLVLSVAASVVLSLSGKYNIYKIDINGKRAEEGHIMYTGVIKTRRNTEGIKKTILLTDRNFDVKPEFSSLSPIKIYKYSSKSGKIEFAFLYEHSDNHALIETGKFEVYLSADGQCETLEILNMAPKRK